MNKTDLLNKYEDYLRKETTLNDTTIQKYISYMKMYFDNDEKVTRQSALRFIISKTSKKHSNVVKYALRHLFFMLKKKDIYDSFPPLKKPTKEKMVRQYDMKTIFKAINNIKNPVYKDIARIQAVTGARVTEILTLKEENVDLNYMVTYTNNENFTITERKISAKITAKGNYTRYLYMPLELEPIIKKYIRGFKGYLFLDRGQKHDDIHFNKKIASVRFMYYRHLNESMVAEGVKGFGTHDLRRSFGTNLIQQGAPITVVRDLLGHKSVQTTELYLPKYGDQAYIHLDALQGRMIKKKEGVSGEKESQAGK